MEYSQRNPEKHGTLFSVANRSLSGRDGQTQVAMGMIAGVSDLIHFENGVFTGCEIKVKGSTHKSSHLKGQINWGKSILNNGGRYFFVTSVEQFFQVITNTGVKTNLDEIEKEIASGKKTITF